MRRTIVGFFMFSLALLSTCSFGQASSPTAATVAASPSPQPAIPRLAVVVPPGNPPEQCVNRIRAAAQEFETTKSDKSLAKVLDFMSNQLCSIYLVMSSAQYHSATIQAQSQLLSLNEAQIAVFRKIARQVKALAQQDGSSAGTGGSTNLVSKGLAAKFISIASEYGALTQSTSNNTTTVQGTLAGVPVVLMKRGLAEECSTKIVALTPCFHHQALDWLNRISYSVSFDTSQNGQSLTGTATPTGAATAQPATFTANSNSVNAVSAKFVAWQSDKIDTDTLEKTFNDFAQQTQRTQIRDLATFFQQREIDPRFSTAFDQWHGTALNDLKAAIGQDPSGRSAIEVWKASGTGFVAALGVPADISPAEAANAEMIQKVADFAVSYAEYLGREEEAFLSMAKPPILTFEYNENRPAGQPSNSVFRVIYQHKFPQISVTANGAFSIYDSAPSSAIPGADRLRDAQAGLELDHDFAIDNSIFGKLGMTASASGYFQYQNSPAILNVDASSPLPGISFTGLPPTANQIFAQKGNIGIGQFKVTVGSGSSIKVPFSVTYASRTELVTKPVWRGQVGVSYDFDWLFSGGK